MATLVTPITVEQFQMIPDPPGGRLELHHGETAFVTAPAKFHKDLQRRLLSLLDARFGADFCVMTEFPCRPLPEYEVWIADVAMTPNHRWDETGDSGWLAGAPELTIEVLSPSNTKAQMEDRMRTFFMGGCRQFWTVDNRKRAIEISYADGSRRTFGIADEISFAEFGAESLPVAEIFRP
jgi:Uma2 family endonuclease